MSRFSSPPPILSSNFKQNFSPSSAYSDPSLLDQTLGGIVYGGADTLRVASAAVGWKGMTDSLQGFMQEHPQYGPQEVQSTYDLITNPKALLGGVARGLPYMLSLAGLMATGPWGLTAAVGLSAALEGRRGYEQALADGQDETMADASAIAHGVVGSFFTLVPLARVFRLAPGASASFTSALVKKATGNILAEGAVGASAKFVAAQTVLGTVGGMAQELIPLELYGKPLAKGFWETLGQAAVNAGMGAESLGLLFQSSHDVFGKSPEMGGESKDLGNLDKYDVSGLSELKKKADVISPHSPSDAQSIALLADAMAKSLAERWGIPVDQAYRMAIDQSQPTLNLLYSPPESNLSIKKVLEAAQFESPDQQFLPKDLKEQMLGKGVLPQDFHQAGIAQMLEGDSPLKASVLQGAVRGRAEEIGVVLKGEEAAKLTTADVVLQGKVIELAQKELLKIQDKPEMAKETARYKDQIKKLQAKQEALFESQFSPPPAVAEGSKTLLFPQGKKGLGAIQFRVDAESKRFFIDSVLTDKGTAAAQVVLSALDVGANKLTFPLPENQSPAQKQLIEKIQKADKNTTTLYNNGQLDVSLSPKLKDKALAALQKGSLSIYSGGIQLAGEGQTVLQTFQNNPKGLMDQLFSSFVKLSDQSTKDVINQFLGRGQGSTEKLSPKDTQKVQLAFNKYLLEGRSPSKDTGALFFGMKQFVKRMYTAAKLDAKVGELPPELKFAFDKILYTPTEGQVGSPITAARSLVQERFKIWQELEKQKPEEGKVEETKSGDSTNPPSIKGFTTSQGSTYVLEGNSTTRTKSPHPGHDLTDVGVKPSSDKTVYIDSATAREIGMWGTSSASGKRIVLEGGKIVLVSDNPATGKKGKDVLIGNAEFSAEPKIGLSPLELWDKNNRGWYRANHPGNAITSLEVEQPPKPPTPAQIAEASYLDAQSQLFALQSKLTSDPNLSEVQRVNAEFGENIVGESPKMGKLRENFTEAYRRIQSFFSIKSAVEGTPLGKKFSQVANKIVGRWGEIVGKFEGRRLEWENSLTSEEKKMAAGESDIQTTHAILSPSTLYLDRIGVPTELRPTTPIPPGLGKTLDLLQSIQGKTNAKAIELKMLRRMRNGEWIPLKAAEFRLPRSYTQRGTQALNAKGGRDWEDLVLATSELNPGLERKQVEDGLAALGQNRLNVVKDAGLLEHSRKIKYIPDFIKPEGGGGNWGFRQTDLHQNMLQFIEKSARELAITEYLGQGKLRTVLPQSMLDLINAISTKNLGEDGVVSIEGLGKRVADALGLKINGKGKIQLEKTDERYAQDTADFGINAEDMSEKELHDAAKAAGILRTATREDLLGILDLFNPSTLTNAQFKKLQRAARKLQGIETHTTDPTTLWADTFQRMKEVSEGETIIRLRNAIQSEHGDIKAFDTMAKQLYGIPLYIPSQNIFARGGRIAESFLSTMQTSLAATPNLPQTVALVPAYAGIKNYFRAVYNVMRKGELTQTEYQALSGIHDAIVAYNHEPGIGAEEAARFVRETVTKATGQMGLQNLNNLIAGEAFRLSGMEWVKGSLSRGDERTLKFLGFDPKEISQLKSGEILEGDQRKWLSRIVRAGIDKTQFTSAKPWEKGYIETIPVVRSIFSYMSYATGTLRAVTNIGGDFFSALKSGDAGQILGETQKLGMMLVGLYGAGLVGGVLRQATKGNFRDLRDQKDKDLKSKIAHSLEEAALLGPTQRVMSTLDYDGGQTEKALIGLSPTLSAFTDLINVAMGQGKFGEFAPGRRASEAVLKNFPLAKGFYSWFDTIAHPEFAKYEMVRQEVGNWEKTHNLEKWGKTAPQTPQMELNPDTFPIFELTSRGDLDGAKELRDKYFAKQMDAGHFATEILSGLRQSLTQRAPISLGNGKFDHLLPLFLNSLSEKRRDEYLGAQWNYMRVVNQLAPNLSR